MGTTHHTPHAAPDALVTDEIVDEIATEIRADRRTVIRRLAGLPVRGRVAADIDRALAARRSCLERQSVRSS